MEDNSAPIVAETYAAHVPLDVTVEPFDKDDIKDVFEDVVLETVAPDESCFIKRGLKTTTEAAAKTEDWIKELKVEVKFDEGIESEKDILEKVNLEDHQKLDRVRTSSQCSSKDKSVSSKGSIFLETGKVSPECGKVSPECGKVSPLNGKLSTDIGKVSLEDGTASPDSGKVSHQNGQFSLESVKLLPQNGQVSPENGQVSPENGQVSLSSGKLSSQNCKLSPVSGKVFPQNITVLPESGKVSPQNMKVSPESCKISPQNMKVSPESCKISPQNIKVSPESGKLSPPVSPQIVVRFSNCSQETGSDLPFVENENVIEEGVESLEDDNKENIFQKGGDESPKWEDLDTEDGTDSVRSSARSASYLAPIQMKLRKACREGDIVTLQKILQENPAIKLDLMDEEGSTCLNDSVTKSCQFEDVTKLLLEAGAGVGIQDQLGNTPLHNAVLYYPATEETIQMLLDRGADTNIRNYDGATPISMADDKDLKKVMRLLSKSAAKGSKIAANRRIVSAGSGSASPADFKIVVEESPGTPSILKKSEGAKRKREEDGEEEGNVKRRRIKFNEKEEAVVRLFSEDE